MAYDVKKHFGADKGRYVEPKPFEVEKRNNGRQPLKIAKPRAWTHQDDLRALKGEKVILYFGGSFATGTLVEADQFTIKLQSEHTDGEVQTEVFFKSALRSFRLLR